MLIEKMHKIVYEIYILIGKMYKKHTLLCIWDRNVETRYAYDGKRIT
jgi:hypothetical protein